MATRVVQRHTSSASTRASSLDSHERDTVTLAPDAEGRTIHVERAERGQGYHCATPNRRDCGLYPVF